MISEIKRGDHFIEWHKPGTDILHNEHGPAEESGESRECDYKGYYINGMTHNEFGPARTNTKWAHKGEYYLYGEYLGRDRSNVGYEESALDNWVSGLLIGEYLIKI